MEPRRERPLMAFVISLLGAAFTFAPGVTHVVQILNDTQSGVMASVPQILFALVFGVLITIFAVLIYSNSENHALWGTFVIVLSIVSVFQGSDIINIVLCITGGILAIKWEPVKIQPEAGNSL